MQATATDDSIVRVEDDFVVFFKRSGLPTCPLKKDPAGSSLLMEASRIFPEIMDVSGRNPWEGGVLHRLDTPTSGLVLIARTQTFFDKMNEEQAKDRFIKYYHAESRKAGDVPGFIDCPYGTWSPAVESAFIAYGPGRKAVRPVLPMSRKWEDGMRLYRTEILSVDGDALDVRLTQGFRHQVRCHSAWLGMPLVGDTLYGGAESEHFGLESYRMDFLGESISSED